jgi:hypothetical protein
VRVRRILDDRDARPARLDQEQRRALRRDRDDDDHVGDVAARDEPLLAADAPAAAVRERLGHRRDRGRVGARVLLGHRVGVLRLAAQHRPQPAVDLRLAPGRPHVVRVRHVPRDPVRRAAELLLDQRPRLVRPPLAAVRDGVEPAGQAGGQRRRPQRGDVIGREPPAGQLGGDLAGDELLVDEAARPLDDVLVGLHGGRRGQRGSLRR